MPKVTSMYKAAIESFAQTGFDRTKMEDIAKRLGLSKGTIYLYFKSKEDLFLAICEYNIQKGDKEDVGLFIRKENVASDAEQIYDNIRRREQGNDRVMLEMVAESARNPKLRKAMYELHVKAFYDNNDDGIGDFRGLMEKLDYIQELGVTAVWLLPTYPSPQRDDGYDCVSDP